MINHAKLMSNKIIISTIIIFLVASFAYLSYTERMQNNYDVDKNWWVIYFAEPKGDNLDFIIENHSDKNNFHWEILADKDKIKEGDIKIANTWKPGFQAADYGNKKITVTVSDDENKKEIYKYLNQ